MKTLETLKELEREAFDKSFNLRAIAIDEKTKAKKSFELRKKQDEIYKKHGFYKNLLKHWKEVENENR